MDKFNLVVRAARELARAVQENYYDLSDLNIINYSEVCEWCNFPDLQDGGIYEQAIAQLFAKAGEWLSSSRSASRE